MNERYNPFEPPGADPGFETRARGEPPAFHGGRTASLGQRLTAALIDAVLLMFSGWTLAMSGLWFTLSWFLDMQLMARVGWAFVELYTSVLTGFALYLLLNGYFLARYAQTIGKRALGIRIVTVADGERASFWRIVLLRLLPQNVAVAVPVVGVYLVTVDLLAILRKDRRCLHDLVAGTRVVRVEHELS